MADKQKKVMKELTKKIELELGLKKVQLFPVWKGFLCFGKDSHKTPLVMWIPNKTVYGLISRKELVDTAIDMVGVTVASIVPFASEVRLLLLEFIPSPPKSRALPANSRGVAAEFHTGTVLRR